MVIRGRQTCLPYGSSRPDIAPLIAIRREDRFFLIKGNCPWRMLPILVRVRQIEFAHFFRGGILAGMRQLLHILHRQTVFDELFGTHGRAWIFEFGG